MQFHCQNHRHLLHSKNTCPLPPPLPYGIHFLNEVPMVKISIKHQILATFNKQKIQF